MIEPSSTEDAMDDAQVISPMFPQLVTSSAPSSNVYEEHVLSFAKVWILLFFNVLPVIIHN